MGSPQRVLAGLVAFLISAAAVNAQFVWTGNAGNPDITLPQNWRGGVVPPNNGTAALSLTSGVGISRTLLLPSNYSLTSIAVGNNDRYFIDSASPVTLTLTNGIAFTTDDPSDAIWLRSNVTLNLSGTQTFDVRAGQIIVSGSITGSGGAIYVSTTVNGFGALIFNNTGVGNTYTGSTILGDGVNSLAAAFWNSQPFGTGPVTINTASGSVDQLIAHGTQTIANGISVSGSGAVAFKSWDDVVVYSGNFMLLNNTTFTAQIAQAFLAAPDQAGSYPEPGPIHRNPIVFSGTIGEAGTSSLLLNGAGLFYFTGNNSTGAYSGGTTINGSAVYASNTSVPSTGSILIGGGGYAGFADATAGQFATFLSSHVNTASSTGSVGFDTLPGQSTATFSSAINFTGFNAGLRLGTASSAILTGTYTPQGSTYQFGGGGGTLYVQSNLTNPYALTLTNSNGTVPLTLYLQGYNVYTGATTVSNGFLVFDGVSAISPSTTTIVAGGASTNVGQSYVGYTDVSGISSAANFLTKLGAASTWGIIGFDTHQGNSTVSINGVDLTGFNNGVFIGTTTSAILTGTLTPSTATNSDNAANTLRFTAAQSGVLTVASNISGSLGVMLGTPAVTGPYSSGTVILSGSNSYSGGTTWNVGNLAGLTVGVGNNNAFGSGPVNLVSNINAGIGYAGLQATSGGINLANNFNLVNTGGAGYAGPQLYFTGTNAFTISGNITGDATTSLNLFNSTPLTVTLAGDNSSFLGGIAVLNGVLNINNNNAAGLGSLDFGDAGSAVVNFGGGGATAPVVYGIDGKSGQIVVNSGTNLTFDASDDVTHNQSFGGVVSGGGSLTITTTTASSQQTFGLIGNNSYTGGTTVSGYAVLGLGSNTGAGTGSVTLNSPNAGILLNSGVTFSNTLVYNSGTLGGSGIFAPSGTTTITFDTNKLVAPGLAGVADGGNPGTLTLNADVVFANGGGYAWTLQDVTRTDGYSLLAINGNLSVTASGGGFLFKIGTFDSTDTLGFANLTLGTPYSLPVLTTTGTITGFNASAFTVDASDFQGGVLSPTVFTLSQSGQTIYLNFTPVPEPSTYALLALGCGVLLLPFRRKRS